MARLHLYLALSLLLIASCMIAIEASMKIYVAAKFTDQERVKEVYALLKDAGHTITHEWIHNKPSYPFSVDPSYTTHCAQNDIAGVLAADVFILLTNAEMSMGSSAELGAAVASYIAFKKPYIYVVGPHFDNNFCYYHPAVHQMDSVEDVLHNIATKIQMAKQNLVQAE
jgi:hypothetical protein